MSPSARRREEESGPGQAPAPRLHRGPRHRARRAPLVLVVDDSVDTRELYATYFRHRGFDAITAADGDEGIALATQRKPAVIVMDLAMPGINGISAAHHLKHDPRTRRIPIILLTGHGHRAIQLRIPGLVDRSKGAAAQQLQELKSAQGPGQLRHSRRRRPRLQAKGGARARLFRASAAPTPHSSGIKDKVIRQCPVRPEQFH